MMITTQPSQFKLDSIDGVSIISSKPGQTFIYSGNSYFTYGRTTRHFLAKGYPGDSYSWMGGGFPTLVIYDEYEGTIPQTPVYPTAGKLYLKPNCYMTVHYFSVQNNYPLGSSLNNHKCYYVNRIKDVADATFLSYPNYRLTPVPLNSNFYQNTTFLDSINPFLENNFDHSKLPSEYSVKLYISWCKWVNKKRMPPPCYDATCYNFGRVNVIWGTAVAEDPYPQMGLAYLHNVYLYK